VATLDFKICVFACFRLSFSINVQEVIVNRDDKSKLLQSNFVNGMPFEIPSDLSYIWGSFALRFFVFHTVFVIVINETPIFSLKPFLFLYAGKTLTWIHLS